MMQQMDQRLKAPYKIRNFQQDAQGLIEYGLIVVLIALVVMGILGLLGGQLDQLYQSIVNALVH